MARIGHIERVFRLTAKKKKSNDKMAQRTSTEVEVSRRRQTENLSKNAKNK